MTLSLGLGLLLSCLLILPSPASPGRVVGVLSEPQSLWLHLPFSVPYSGIQATGNKQGRQSEGWSGRAYWERLPSDAC